MSLSRTIRRTIRQRRTGSRVAESTLRRRFRRAQYAAGHKPATVRVLERLFFRDLIFRDFAPRVRPFFSRRSA